MQGIASITLAMMSLLILAVVGFIGWQIAHHAVLLQKGSATSQHSSCLGTYHDKNLCHYAEHNFSIVDNSFTSNIHVTSPQGIISTLKFSADGKGNTSVDGTANGQELSTILLNGATYVKTNGLSWIEYPKGATNAPAQTNPTATMDITVGNKDLRFSYLGRMSCGNISCYKYLVGEQSQPATTQYIWFDTTGYLLREWSYQGATGTTDMTISSYQPVTITAPSPVQIV
ncbi:MAG TPA: hypothetical protein VGS08_04900 [Candidatus Saccharimonadales bacterium]|nr:hypothetical protein [Candidatus Saccharimonadales bacterium]